MSFTITINYGAGDVELTDYSGQQLVYQKSLKKTTAVHGKKYKHETSKAYFEFRTVPSLTSALMGLDRDQTITVEILEDATPWFTGFIRPITAFSDPPGPGTDPVSVECVDALWVLQKQPGTYLARDPDDSMTVCDTTTTSQSMIHWILGQAGFTGTINAFDITDDIEWFLMHPDDEFLETLDEFCFSHHCTFYAGADGSFNLYDWGKPSADISSSGTIDEAHIRGSLGIKRETTEIKTPKVEYYNIVRKNDVQVSQNSEMFGLDYDGDAVVWENYYDYDEDEEITASPSHTVPAEFSFPADAIGVISSRLKVVGRAGYVIAVTPLAGFEKTRYIDLPATNQPLGADFLSRVSSSGSETDYILSYLFEYTGADNGLADGISLVASLCDLRCREKAGTALGKDIGASTKTYKGLYCYTELAGRTLATALSYNLEYGEFKYSFDSIEDFNVGEYYTIIDDEFNVSALCRIVKKSEKRTNPFQTVYTYEARRYSGFTTIVDSVTEATGSTVITERDESRPIVGSDLTESTDVTVMESGLYLCRDRMGFYDADSGEWTAVIEVDGSFSFKGDGDVGGTLNVGRLIFDNTGLSMEEYIGSLFSTYNQLGIGGLDADGVFYPFFTGRGLIHPQAPIVDTSEIGELYPAEYIFRFDTGMSNDSSSLEMFLDATRGERTTAWSKFGTHSICNNGAATGQIARLLASASDEIPGEMLLDNDISIACWMYHPTGSLPDGDEKFIYQVINLDTNGDYYRAGIVYTAATRELSAMSQYFDLSTDTGYRADTDSVIINDTDPHYIGISWDALEHTITLIVDGVEIGSAANTLWGSPISIEYGEMYIYGGNDSPAATDDPGWYIDEFLLAPAKQVNIDVLIQHYNHDRPWGAFGYTDKDLLLIPADGGKTRISYQMNDLFGCQCSPGTDSDHDIDVTAGRRRSRFDRYNLDAGQATVSIDQTWNDATGVWGLFSGASLSAGDTAHLFLIRNSATGKTRHGFDDNINCTNIPTGYKGFRRIGSFRLDASGNLNFSGQRGNFFELAITTQSYAETTTVPTTQTDIDSGVPTGFPLLAEVVITRYNNGFAFTNYGSPDTSLPVPSDNNALISVDSASMKTQAAATIPTDTDGKISIRSSTSSGWISCMAVGWHDDLGAFNGV